MKKLLPLLLALIGLGGGMGAGLMLRPAAHPPEGEAAVEGAAAPEGEAATAEGEAPAEGEDAAAAEGEGEGEADPATAPEYVKMSNQFVIPVVSEGEVASMVLLSLSLEVKAGGTEQTYSIEPKLRDAFLQVLFDHANSGGFAGSFTDGANLVVLRRALLEVARKTTGDLVLDVLISDITRQDA